MKIRKIILSNNWVIKIGRGLDFYLPIYNYYNVGANDMNLRQCKETDVEIYKEK